MFLDVAAQGQMVRHQAQAQILVARSYIRNLWEQAWCKHHDGDTSVLRGSPEPIGGAISEPSPIRATMERQAHAQHAGLTFPGID